MFVVQARTKALFQVLIISVLSCATVFAQSPKQQPVDQGIRIVRSDVHHDVSPTLLEMIKMRNELAPVSQEQEAEPLRLIPLPPGLKPATDPDPVLQTTTNSPV